MRSLDALSWPARRWLADRLVGQHAYSRNVATLEAVTSSSPTLLNPDGKPMTYVLDFYGQRQRIFDQERI